MDTPTFNAAFDAAFGTMAVRNGGHQRGRSIFVPTGDLMVGVTRVEFQWQPPPRLVAMIRHRAMRTTEEVVPTKPPGYPIDWPIHIQPSRIADLVSPTWTFEYNSRAYELGEVVRWEGQSFEALRERLDAMASTIERQLLRLPEVLTAERLLAEFTAQQERSEWWIVGMWVDDLMGFL